MTSNPANPVVPPASTDIVDIDDSSDTEARFRTMRDQLKWRINTCTHPSRLINQLCLADMRCRESAKTLTHLTERSPRILKVIRAELYKEFNEDPDDLLFTVPAKDGDPEKVDNLTGRALSMLFEPRIDANVCSSTTLSIKAKPGYRLTLTPFDVLQRVSAMRLVERLVVAATDYWDMLVYGSWLTRRERWVDLHRVLFADRAFVARQLNELSSTGMAMLQAVIDAPSAEARQRAGGEWAAVRVGLLLWPGTPAIAIPGALHIYREGEPEGVPHVIYLPGVARNFYEYPSFVAFQCGVLQLSQSRFEELWQCLPLNRRQTLCRPADLSPASSVVLGSEILEDALALVTRALLRQQWDNELACAVTVYHQQVFAKERSQPLNSSFFLKHVEGSRRLLVGDGPLGELCDELLNWDQQRRHADIIFASTAPGLPLHTVEQQITRYEKGLVALLDPNDPSAETPAYQEAVALVSQLKVHADTLNAITQGARQRLLGFAFWTERLGGAGTPRRGVSFMHAQTEALRCEVQLQHKLKLLSTAHRDLIIEVVEQPLPSRRPGSQTQVLSIAIGSELDGFSSLDNVWVVTTAAAVRVPKRQLPVVLYAVGEEGGVMGFAGLDALTRSVKASLVSRDDSMLWGCIARDKRSGLRAHATHETLEVRYVPILKKPAVVFIRKLLGSYDRLHCSVDEITRIFSEVKDAELSRALLLTELEQRLQVPVNSALSHAQTNVELLRNLALEAKKLPAWLTTAANAQRRRFRRLQKHHMSNAWAFLARHEQRLPDLMTYARQALSARLRRDGIALQVALDEPFIVMSGDIHGTYCDYEEACRLRDPRMRLSPSSSCRAFSLLELALHNLDPQATWTQYKLNRACVLRSPWPGFHVNHLRQIISSLDIGGRYDALINKAFYPAVNPDHPLSEGRIPELLNRALRAGIDFHLYVAAQEGLSANAQSVFSTAMAARTPQDLLKNQHQLQLYKVHLVGHTMQHDRYVAGIVVVQDKRSALCVIYWPQAPHACVLTEYSSLDKARAELSRLGALPDNAKTLARQVAPGWAFQSGPDPMAVSIVDMFSGGFLVKGYWQAYRTFRVKYPEPSLSIHEIEEQVLDQIASDPQEWLALVASSHCNAQALLYRGHVLELQRQTQAASYSNKALEEYRIRRRRDDSVAKVRMVLGLFIPIVGVFSDIYQLYGAVRRYLRSGNPGDKRVLADTVKFFTVGLVMALVPGPKRVGVSTAALGRIRRWRVEPSSVSHSAPSVRQLPGLERFKVKSVPEEAVALRGPDQNGVYIKNGELFVADDAHHYPVYRRANETSFRLKNPQVPGQDELIINIRQSKEWLLAADAPLPLAGSSSGVLNPWRSPVAPAPDWRLPVVRTSTENTIRQSTTTASHWIDWDIPTPNGLQVTLAPHVYQVPADASGVAGNVVRIAPMHNTSLQDPLSSYYRLLPQGDQAPLDGIVFMTRNERSVSPVHVDIERWTSAAPLEQPIAMSFTGQNQWKLHAPLFDRPLTESVGEAFPTLKGTSRARVVARMIELSGPPGPATATHLLNIRATLDKWLSPLMARRGKTDDLLQMLQPCNRHGTSLSINYDGDNRVFNRVDFQISGLDASLWLPKGRVANQRELAQRAAVKEELKQQGFKVRDREVSSGGPHTHSLIATHPNSNMLYYVTLHWAEGGSIRLEKKLTTAWLNKIINRYSASRTLADVKSAMEEGRLVRIAAGIQWPVERDIPSSVYFVKVNPA